MSARGSRFLLPGWASAGEARGGQKPGSPYSVPWEPRGGRGAPPPPSPLRRVTLPGPHVPDGRVTSEQQLLQCGSAAAFIPSRTLSSRPFSTRPGGLRAREGCSSQRPILPQRRILAQRTPGKPGSRALARDSSPRGGMCGRTLCPRRSIYSRWHCPSLVQPERLSAGGTARPLSVLPQEPRLICPSPSPSKMDMGKTAQNTRRQSSHQALPSSITPSSCPRFGWWEE